MLQSSKSGRLDWNTECLHRWHGPTISICLAWNLQFVTWKHSYAVAFQWPIRSSHQKPSLASSALKVARRLSFMASVRAVCFAYFLSWNFDDYSFLLSSRVEMTPALVHPVSVASSSRLVKFLRDLSLRHLRASGMTILFFWSYGYGIPSKHFSLLRAAVPFGSLWGSMPRTDFQKMRDGAFQCLAPLRGFVLIRFFIISWRIILFLRRDPDFKILSHLTTTTRCPLINSLATMLPRRPYMWPFPSIINSFSNMLRFLINNK